jgi:nitrite reductase/ring-hydroxylating ferredoxin subunit
MRGWDVGPAEEFDSQGMHRRIVQVNGRDVVVFRRGERWYALENTCLHMGGPVGEGLIIGKVEGIVNDGRYIGERFSASDIHIVCPWHGYEYNIEDGRCSGDRRLHLEVYQVEERDGVVYVFE